MQSNCTNIMVFNKCCLCKITIIRADFLSPSRCLQMHGQRKSHKICQSCWWSEFAIEEKTHICPGCTEDLDFPYDTVNK